MGAGAKGKARIQNHLISFCFIGVFQPVGEHHKSFSHLLRGIVVLPALLPVGFRQGLYGDGKLLFLGKALQHGKARLLRILQIQLDPAQALQALFQALVNIIPVFPVFFQEVLKLLLILDTQIIKAQAGQGGCQLIDGTGPGVEGDFQPCHCRPSSFAAQMYI